MTAASIGVRVALVCRSPERVDAPPVAFRRPQDPIRPFLCTDALRLTDLLLETKRRRTRTFTPSPTCSASTWHAWPPAWMTSASASRWRKPPSDRVQIWLRPVVVLS
jgi:hypothetical protein